MSRFDAVYVGENVQEEEKKVIQSLNEDEKFYNIEEVDQVVSQADWDTPDEVEGLIFSDGSLGVLNLDEIDIDPVDPNTS